MFHKIGIWSLHQRKLLNFTSLRQMTSTEVSTALRPFYFSVHPDLFGQHPTQRTTNENSLKQLSAFLETLQNKHMAIPCDLQFYIKDKKDSLNANKLRLVKIKIKEKNVRDVVLNILKSFELSTDYVDKIPVKITPTVSMSENFSNFTKNSPFESGDIDFSNVSEDDPIFGPLIKRKINHARDMQTLKTWILKNHKTALDNTNDYKPIKDEVMKLQKELTQEWGILDIKWDCGWNEKHYKACLQGLKYIAEQYPHVMHVLRGRILIFAAFTGVSLEGHIMLNTGEVRHNWLDMIRNIRQYEEALTRIPAFEKSVSQVLRDIQVQRRKFMPKIVANDYEKNLQKLTTTLLDYRGKRNFPQSWPQSLSNYQIVVETEAGPLMVSPTGQFIVPCSCPGFLLVKFITENLQEALDLMEGYRNNKYVERSLKRQCASELELEDLRKDDAVSPDLMIKCCKSLLSHKTHLQHLKGVHLNITTYYSVLSDGLVCIPWNYVL